MGSNMFEENDRVRVVKEFDFEDGTVPVGAVATVRLPKRGAALYETGDGIPSVAMVIDGETALTIAPASHLASEG